MKIILGENEQQIETRKATIIIGDNEFRIILNQFDEIVINKFSFGDEDSTMIIKPSVSNQIRIK